MLSYTLKVGQDYPSRTDLNLRPRQADNRYPKS
jgi:hypothetical protein